MNYLAAIIIPAYIALMVLIMVIVGRKSSNSLKDYALAGGGLPWFVTAGTIVASLIGGGTNGYGWVSVWRVPFFSLR